MSFVSCYRGNIRRSVSRLSTDEDCLVEVEFLISVYVNVLIRFHSFTMTLHQDFGSRRSQTPESPGSPCLLFPWKVLYFLLIKQLCSCNSMNFSRNIMTYSCSIVSSLIILQKKILVALWLNSQNLWWFFLFNLALICRGKFLNTGITSFSVFRI